MCVGVASSMGFGPPETPRQFWGEGEGGGVPSQTETVMWGRMAAALEAQTSAIQLQLKHDKVTIVGYLPENDNAMYAAPLFDLYFVKVGLYVVGKDLYRRLEDIALHEGSEGMVHYKAVV